MPKLLGEYEVKIDAKGRLRVPSDLIKQLGDGWRSTFVMNRGFEKCLVLYPKSVWDKITTQIDKLSDYNRKNRTFKRYFYRGATELELDKSDRILVSKRLLDYAELDKELVLFAYNDKVEIWAADKYESWMDDEPEDFAALAEEVMEDIEREMEK